MSSDSAYSDGASAGSDAGVSKPPEVCDGVDNDGDSVVDFPECDADLIAWYTFEAKVSEGSGGWIVWDISGYGHHGWVEGDAFINPMRDALCNMSKFTWAEGWAVVPDAPDLTPQTGMTIEYWAFMTFGMPGGIAKYGIADNERSYAITVTSSELRLWLSEAGDAPDLYATATCSGLCFANMNAQHVAATFDPATGESKVFLDGIQASVDVQGSLSNIHPGSADLLIHATPLESFGSLVFGANGCIDEVKIWRTVRTEAEICADAGGVYDPVGQTCSLPAP